MICGVAKSQAVAFALCVFFLGMKPALSQSQIVTTFYGVGQDSCAKFVAATTGLKPGEYGSLSQNGTKYLDPAGVYKAWIAGFLSARNQERTEKQSNLTNDFVAIDLWIRNYCQQHPLDMIALAADKLFDVWQQEH